MLKWACLVVLLLVLSFVGWRVAAARLAPSPADLFMQSVANGDGGLGWRQLCAGLQAQLPVDVLQAEADTQRTLHAQQGVTLTVDHVGDRPRAGGGQIRVYVATAHGGDGATAQKTYVLSTQPSGCVESVD
jgi:hypothetical protein